MESFIYQGKEIKYYVDRGKRKNYYITIKAGEVVFKVPRGTPDFKVKQLIETKKDWIYKHLTQKPVFINKKNQYEEGEKFFLGGIGYPLKKQYFDKKRGKLLFEDNCFKAYIPEEIKNTSEEKELVRKLFDKFYFEFAEIKIKEIFPVLIEYTGLKPKQYRVRNLKSAWGNCSSKQGICINKDIVKFSDGAIEYVCIHELCHLRYLNHSKDFWKLVKAYMPDYKKYEEELKH